MFSALSTSDHLEYSTAQHTERASVPGVFTAEDTGCHKVHGTWTPRRTRLLQKTPGYPSPTRGIRTRYRSHLWILRSSKRNEQFRLHSPVHPSGDLHEKRAASHMKHVIDQTPLPLVYTCHYYSLNPRRSQVEQEGTVYTS